MADDTILDYWHKHYADEHCTLCGNWGVIDTRASAVTPAGYRAGRLNFCLCPNGRTLRDGGADINRVLTNERWSTWAMCSRGGEMRVLVCGGRDFVNVPVLWRRLDEIHAKRPITTIIEGASDDVTGPYQGADYWAHQWGLARGVETIRVHAKWTVMGRAAGPLRNKEMAHEHRPDLVISFPGGRGTANMLRTASEANIPIQSVTHR